ncbi:unnamed protein product [Cunninghamella blakesleeana]
MRRHYMTKHRVMLPLLYEIAKKETEFGAPSNAIFLIHASSNKNKKNNYNVKKFKRHQLFTKIMADSLSILIWNTPFNQFTLNLLWIFSYILKKKHWVLKP